MNFEQLLFQEVPEIKPFMQEIKHINDDKFLVGRTGWVDRGIAQAETIYEHMCKINLATLYLFGHLPDEAIAHELPEGEKKGFDYKPGQISLEEKKKREKNGMVILSNQISNGNRWLVGWLNFEERLTKVAEPIFNLDKLCPCIEILNLTKEYCPKESTLDEFLPYALGKMTVPELKDLLVEMYQTPIPLSVNAYSIYFEKLKEINLDL